MMNKHGIRFAMVCLLGLLAGQQSIASEGGPVLAKEGKSLFEDDFSRSVLAPKWRQGKGSWAVKDGVVSAVENPEDKHQAYAYVTPNFQFKDIVAEFSVKLDGGRNCSLMINDNKYKESHAGHILKATLAQDGKVNVADWKFGAMKNDIFTKMKDPATTAEEKKKLTESIKSTTATFTSGAETSQWHTMRVEIVGSEMLVSLDSKPVAYIKSEGVDHATKNAIGFECGGKETLIKGMKVWEATASPDWSSKREAVIGSLKK